MNELIKKIAEDAFRDELQKIALMSPMAFSKATEVSMPTVRTAFNVARQLKPNPVARKQYLQKQFGLQPSQKSQGLLNRFSSWVKG